MLPMHYRDGIAGPSPSSIFSSPAAPSLLRKLAAQVVVYNIWRQRNNLLHNSERLAPNLLFSKKTTALEKIRFYIWFEMYCTERLEKPSAT
ncbi:unnamed protein product [Arabidopsis lyrata]|nr:unnamed protein product [Arabidopsis lyrata]